MNFTANDLINLQDYPIHVKGQRHQKLIERIRTDLAADGCAIVKRFLTDYGVCALKNEADSVSRNGHRSFSRTNPYFTQDEPSLSEDDPRRAFFDRSNNFISADNFAPSGALRTIHDFPSFDPFIRDCLQEENFYRYADPLADVIINMAETGNGFPWHFDTNNFTVTLAIQNATSGGEFEYAPHIRVDDENFPEVKKVLEGTSNRVRTINLEPGDLQLFQGRYSLHRVAPLSGSIPRYVAIFSYVQKPGMVGTPERSKQLYGKALPIHFERAGWREDSYLD
ncbi:MAG: hypothetical protein DHS20C01_22270 [marine bacterium B5-7]|nr:MAG: hypothetical protein DHS20C01_22270 [marine bacterium B5-7]